jgi:Flp pilus assembly protein TadG
VRSTERSQRGQSLVEFAVLLPILILVTMGAVDFGRVFYAYTTIANAAYQGALCAAQGATMCPAGATASVNSEIGGKLPGGVTTTVAATAGPSFTVTVTYNFQTVTTAVLGTNAVPVRASATVAVQ